MENVIVRENESIVVGTVKVKNLSFHKEVIVRATWDDWKSQQDIFCTYSQVRIKGTIEEVNNLIILFLFRFMEAVRLMFCMTHSALKSLYLHRLRNWNSVFVSDQTERSIGTTTM